ncbi:uncharacterized protein YggU (UPF0235/DUF167 family) [Flavobacterium sp. 2755]|uniref:hypothetical protein n=1 Tax=Flavobacterium sp. 2755 TaxID=2817765 RepID=UPI002860E66A|nr:hypothetical protein [Flavobacterium sp. 2755]MDR6762088.1 uncharacterized protein YggU (UPF0235/DUF167 family) [Flavobacterium sp. 2755]
MNIEKENLFNAIKIADQIIMESKNIDSSTKEAMLNLSKDIINRINKKCENGKANLTLINFYKKEFLTYWSESTSLETEKFWKNLKIRNIGYERKDPLFFALNKNRFINVHQGIDARKNWKDILEFGYINERYTKDQIQKINDVIEKDENDRLDFIKKCLKNERIPLKGMRFNDSIAYFRHCNLLSKYFDEETIKKLYTLT